MPDTIDRLTPSHYEPVRLPPQVAALASVPDTLRPGSPAKVGILDLEFALVDGRTELVGRYQKAPLHLMRPLWIDPNLPGMAFTYIMATGGGIAQADRYRLDFRCGEDTEVHITTQAATKVYRMEHDYATQLVHLTADPGSYVEYLPDQLIPFEDARLYQRTLVTLAPGATVVLGEIIASGRVGRGERHAYQVVATDLRVQRPDGALLALDTIRLEPDKDGAEHDRPGAGVLGPGVFADHDYVATLYVLTDRKPAGEIADALHEALADHPVLHGASTLPNDCGAWIRILAEDAITAKAAHRAAWDRVRRLLIGHPAPDLRKA